ncbi:MAG: hypothetical protein AB8H79_03635, partial [Myxococcota bacterium]
MTVFLGLTACTGSAHSSSEASPEQLLVLCNGKPSEGDFGDLAACRKLGHHQLSVGEREEGVRHLKLACTSIAAACADLAAIYMDGKLVPQDFKEGFKIARLGCGALKADGNACGWAVLDTLREDTGTAGLRNAFEYTLADSCYPKNAGWACYNYGVA